MRIGRKIVAVLLVVALLLVTVSTGTVDLAFTAQAETSGYYTYEVTDGEATITDVDTSISGNVVIPETLGGYPVTCIGYYAFEKCVSLTSVSIPDTVTRICYYAFDWCSSLTSVSIPDSVMIIEMGAFSRCIALKKVTIPKHVTRIGWYLFQWCSALTSVTIPDGVTSIGHRAFDGCTALTSVEIPNSVTEIVVAAFADCSALTDVYYGGSEEARSDIVIGTDNDSLLNATWHYNIGRVVVGNVDSNDKVDSTDARLVLQYAVKKIDTSALNVSAADVNGDSKVDSTDARLILQYAVKKIDKLPAA